MTYITIALDLKWLALAHVIQSEFLGRKVCLCYLFPHLCIEVQDPGIIDEFVVLVPAS